MNIASSVARIVAVFGATGAVACSVKYLISKNANDSEVKKAVQTTKNLSLPDFNKIEKSVEKGTITWERALDSLQRDSIAKKSYFEGAQMVRDSIKTATKVAKAIK